MNLQNLQSAEFRRRANAYYLALNRAALPKISQPAWSRRQFVRTAASAAVVGAGLGAGLWRPQLAAAKDEHDDKGDQGEQGHRGDFAPISIPGGTPILGGGFHVFGPGTIDPVDAEPSSITDFNGFVGIAFISGMVTRTNTRTGEVRTLPFVNSDMRFMQGTYRGVDGKMHQGSFGFV